MPGRKASKKGQPLTPITLQQPDIRVIQLRVIGTTELIMHNWSARSIQAIEDKQAGRTVTQAPRNPDQEYLDSMYRLEDGAYGMPAGAFKSALVDACREFDGLAMTEVRQAVFILHDGFDQVSSKPCVRILAEPHMRRDMVRLETGVATIAYRAGFRQWSAILQIEFNARLITTDQIVNLADGGGRAGIGEWRPSSKKGKSGWAGRFRIETLQ